MYFLHTLLAGPCAAPVYGGCAHLCFPSNETTAVCKCDFGYELADDKKNCTTSRYH